MTSLFSQAGIKARLLGVMALIILPIALASVLIASSNYWSGVERIEADRAQIANDFSARTRIWYRGAMRSLLATYSAIEVSGSNTALCETISAASLKANVGYSALRVWLPDGRSCGSSLLPSLTQDVLEKVAGELVLKPSVRAWVGPMLSPTRYDVFRSPEGRNFLVIHLAPPAADGSSGSAIMLVETALLDAVYNIGPLNSATVALVRRGFGTVVARGAMDDTDEWLPKIIPETTEFMKFETKARSGNEYPYSITPLAGTDLIMLARFSLDETNALRQQYILMALTPVAILGLLFLAYMRAIENDLLRWIMGIKQAARARISDAQSHTLAPIGEDMPRELRSVATAFNTMVTEGQTRERALVRSLEENRFLMRELHHRVKNSLQVIQSYLALSRRLKAEQEQGPLAEIEARVLVLSVAYRLALGEGGMRTVALQPFATEIVNNLTTNLKRTNQKIAVSTRTDAALEVDQVIPFGLVIVECVAASLASPECEAVNIHLSRTDSRELELTISASPIGSATLPNAKILRGLCLQLRADPLPVDADTLLRWRLTES